MSDDDRELTVDEAQRALSEAMRRTLATVPVDTGAGTDVQSWENFREWVATTLDVFLAPDGLVATPETVDQFAQILECRAKELAVPVPLPDAAPSPSQHGRDCPKVPHVGAGYLHGAADDGPYDVDGVLYCGRCHGWLGTAHITRSLASPPAKEPTR